MRFLIADTFTSSLGKLTNEEQTFVKNTAFDLQVNPAHPGLQFHRIECAKDKNFWSVRSGRDLRIIVHKTSANFLLCYVDHHDAAYDWAERRKLETHPETGAAQLVEIRELVKIIPKYVEQVFEKPARRPFANFTSAQLLKHGVPSGWLDDIRNATEESLLDLFSHLPVEAGEALLELATSPQPVVEMTDACISCTMVAEASEPLLMIHFLILMRSDDSFWFHQVMNCREHLSTRGTSGQFIYIRSSEVLWNGTS